MGRIQRLDEHLTNMIAAGEVVERPQGIVKELVENSIDAKAKRIEVVLKQGGLESIEVMDDGCGMDREDACLAFERHATSKIAKVEDLWSIHTMGFRGEALPSIASVSNLILLTNDGKDSTRIEINYGKMNSARPYPTNQGTQITVGGLFLKTPARLKHLKSPQYENSLVLDVIQKFALSHPEISFRMISDGRELFKTTGKGDLLEVLYAVYGKEAAHQAVKIDASDYDYQLKGALILPNVSRATKNYITTFINGRMIRNYRIQKAILEGFHDYMPSDRYPIVVLDILMDAQLVDVNVHPSKWEIRLSKEQQLEFLIKDTLEALLRDSMRTREVESVSSAYPDADKQKEKIRVEMQPLFEEKTFEAKDFRDSGHKNADAFYTKEESAKKEDLQEEMKDWEVREQQVDYKQSIRSEEQPAEFLKKAPFPSMHVLAQMHGCYILAQGEDGLYIIDQHAAQERVHFEEVQKKFMEAEPAMTHLLVPIVVEGTAEIAARLEEFNECLQPYSIQFESFGNNSLMVRELPVWMNQIDEQKFLQDVVDLFKNNRTIRFENLQRHQLATMACHRSIRFNRILSLEEMQEVIVQLGQCEQPFHCPHGRPTFIHISNAQLMKEFNR